MSLHLKNFASSLPRLLINDLGIHRLMVYEHLVKFTIIMIKNHGIGNNQF